MNASELMTAGAATCRLDDWASHAAKLMWESDHGAVVVVDEKGRAVGMVTDRDLCMAAYAERVPLSELRVAAAASHELFAVAESADASEIEAVMRDRKVRRVPVIDRQGFPVGVVSLADLVREASQDVHAVGARGILSTLAAIGEPYERRAHESVG